MMMPRIVDLSLRARARVAGGLYLITVPLGFFSLQYVPSHLFVHGDAAATAQNIQASAFLFRLGIVSDLLGQIALLVAALALYQLLKSVDQNMAWLLIIFNLLGIPITMLSELNNMAVLFLLSGAESLKAFTTDQLHAFIALFLNLHGAGLSIAEIFWGLWLFPMGYLVFRSGFLPRILGILLLMSAVGYVLDSVTTVLFPTWDVNIVLYTSWGELLFPLWLVFIGAMGKQRYHDAPATA
jgi:hypothetical protein